MFIKRHAIKFLALFFALLLLAVSSSRSETFKEDFSRGLDPQKWTISTWTAPQNSGTNHARFHQEYVEVKDGILRLKLTQFQNPDGTITSIGSEMKTVDSFGYGIYTLRMQASSDSPSPAVSGAPASGSVTGVAVFKNKSQTEIDIEVEGVRPSLTQTSTWINESKVETFRIPPKRGASLPHDGFHDYKIIWVPDLVRFYRDGILVSSHKGVVPSAPAPFLLNHWGTNNDTWGGRASPGVDRYMFVKSFTFTPINPAKLVDKLKILGWG